ncbi:MAG: LytTR family transcriptional regulator DNA-binding domain-containing protein [Bacteroidetes bacterium]|nr:LytTR family transcriptional regulator DNA-binding domain-containing protein [Bacteroidota bacterium]
MNIRALIVDDEYHAREGLRIRLQKYPEIMIIAECSTGTEAIDAINTLNPDLVFLDIQMPELNGFEVLKQIHHEPPLIIFVTAYDRYAIQAFEYHALDYLLKPVKEERFHDTIQHAIQELKHRQIQNYSERLTKLLNEYPILPDGDTSRTLSTFHEPITRILLKQKDHIVIVPVEDIDWIESAGDYVVIHSNNQKYIHRETLSSMEESLDHLQFVRIHRSTIVNIQKVHTLKPNESGDYDIFLRDGTRLRLSRNYKTKFQVLLQRAK